MYRAHLPALRGADLSARALLVYLALCTYCSGRGGYGIGWATRERLADDVGASRATVGRALAELRDAGIVEWHRTRGANRYRLTVQG